MNTIVNDSRPEAALVLADGTTFFGCAIGAKRSTTGMVFFDTAVTGYEEIMTTPASAGKIIAFCYPHIGNVGVNAQDEESPSVYAAGVVMRSVSLVASNFRATETFTDYLLRHNVVGITDVDTRRLTRYLRDKGAQAGTIVVAKEKELTTEEVAQARESALAFDAKKAPEVVSYKAPYEFTEGEWGLTNGKDGTPGFKAGDTLTHHVVVYDMGVAKDTLRCLVQKGLKVTVVPQGTPLEEVFAFQPEGVFISDGPEALDVNASAREVASACLARKIPLMGVGAGQDVVAVAAGAALKSLPVGSHGANHPVANVATGDVMITTQRYAVAVDETTLPRTVRVSHRSLFDGTAQALEWVDAPALTFKGDLHVSVDPHNAGEFLARFIAMMNK